MFVCALFSLFFVSASNDGFAMAKSKTKSGSDFESIFGDYYKGKGKKYGAVAYYDVHGNDIKSKHIQSLTTYRPSEYTPNNIFTNVIKPKTGGKQKGVTGEPYYALPTTSLAEPIGKLKPDEIKALYKGASSTVKNSAIYYFDNVKGFFDNIETKFKSEKDAHRRRGLEFILHSAAGIKYNEADKAKRYEEFKKNGGFGEMNVRMTLQMMRSKEIAQYDEDNSGDEKLSEGKKNKKDPIFINVGKTNTAYVDGRQVMTEEPKKRTINNNIVAYEDNNIQDSLVVVMWAKRGGEYKPLWILRLQCANPIGASTLEGHCEEAYGVSVSADKKSVNLPKNGKTTVTFKYNITKDEEGFSSDNTKVNYNIFAGSAPKTNDLSISEANIKRQKSSTGGKVDDFKNPGGDTKKVSTSAPKGIKKTDSYYEETVEISEDTKSKNWFETSPGVSGIVCRRITAKPGEGVKVKKGDTCPNLVGDDSECVTIKLGTMDPDGGLFVNDLVPNIASIGTPINEQYNGINSYVLRPAQFTQRNKTINASSGWHANDSTSARDEFVKNVKKGCADFCSDDKHHRRECGITGMNPVPNSTSCNCKTCHDKEGWPYACNCDTCYQYSGTGTCSYKYRKINNAKWEITKFIVRPEDSTPEKIGMSSKTGTDKNPCQYYRAEAIKQGAKANNIKCDTYRSGTFNSDNINTYHVDNGFENPYNNSQTEFSTSFNTFTIITPATGGINEKVKSALNAGGMAQYTVENDLPVGSKVCFGLSMDPWLDCDSDGNCPGGVTKTGDWRHSAPKCFIVSKKPYFSVENGMILTNGKILTNINLRDNGQIKTGSWSEYATIARKSISSNFATNAATFGGTNNPKDKWNYLTFANNPENGNFDTNPTGQMINPISFFRNNAPPNDDSVKYANTTIHRHKNDTKINSGLAPGVHYYDSDKVEITGNIARAANGQQIVIVAKKDLVINDNVTEINAWLLVGGQLATSPTGLTDGHILEKENPLTIYGPVRAKTIRFRRTYGSGVKGDNLKNLSANKDQFTEAAERFVDTADTYIWSYYNSLDKGRIQTVYLREVAPRY